MRDEALVEQVLGVGAGQPADDARWRDHRFDQPVGKLVTRARPGDRHLDVDAGSLPPEAGKQLRQ